ncbi:chromosomal replication initiator DnaA [Sphingomonas japonica]|uniref:DnaA protein n=1 Tax=Sphingomonas japonica TaxID=511662 RepID=A0ABX0U833_9SPHN|nr:chromosomal replication initiator DnaA [Sphingomonas japonica]NIJ24962.1 hypothetical protein [Sphingomonas japonica]
MTQLGLPLVKPADAREAEFLISDANARAVHQLDHWGTWPVMAAMLAGPRKSGRSMLARYFVGKAGGSMIDDAERVAETDLFHAWNIAQVERRPLLIVVDAPPPEWRVRLPDLRSRLAATPVLRIGIPDDALIGDLLTELFRRRELDARSELVRWLSRRIERSYVTIHRVVDTLEQLATSRNSRKLSIPLAKPVLIEARLLIDGDTDARNEAE